MRGCIIKRGDSYRIKISLGKDPKTGKYLSHYETVGTNKKQAEKRLNELIYQFETGSYIKTSNITVTDFLNQWLKDYVYMNLSPRTAEAYASIIQCHLNPYFSNIVLSQLRSDMIQSYITDKLINGRVKSGGSLSSTTVKHHVVCLHTALQSAVKFGLLLRNPASAITMPKTIKAEMHTMNESDIKHFLDLAKGATYYTLFYMYLFQIYKTF